MHGNFSIILNSIAHGGEVQATLYLQPRNSDSAVTELSCLLLTDRMAQNQARRVDDVDVPGDCLKLRLLIPLDATFDASVLSSKLVSLLANLNLWHPHVSTYCTLTDSTKSCLDTRFTATYLSKPTDSKEYLYSLYGSDCHFQCEVCEPQSEEEPSFKLVTMVCAKEAEVGALKMELYHNGLDASSEGKVVKKLMKYICSNLLKIEAERIVKKDQACYQIQPLPGVQ